METSSPNLIYDPKAKAAMSMAEAFYSGLIAVALMLCGYGAHLVHKRLESRGVRSWAWKLGISLFLVGFGVSMLKLFGGDAGFPGILIESAGQGLGLGFWGLMIGAAADFVGRKKARQNSRLQSDAEISAIQTAPALSWELRDQIIGQICRITDQLIEEISYEEFARGKIVVNFRARSCSWRDGQEPSEGLEGHPVSLEDMGDEAHSFLRSAFEVTGERRDYAVDRFALAIHIVLIRKCPAYSNLRFEDTRLS